MRGRWLPSLVLRIIVEVSNFSDQRDSEVLGVFKVADVLFFLVLILEFDNFGAVMSVSEDLLCAFELLKPLDGAALKKEMAKNKRRSQMQHQSPPARVTQGSY